MSKNDQYPVRLSIEKLDSLINFVDRWASENDCGLEETAVTLMAVSAEICKEIERNTHDPAAYKFISLANFFAKQLESASKEEFRGNVDPPRRLQ